MKFMIVVLFAVLLAANAKRPMLSGTVKAYEETTTIGENTSAANLVLQFPSIPQRLCARCAITCQDNCERLGFKYGIFDSRNGRCPCRNELPPV